MKEANAAILTTVAEAASLYESDTVLWSEAQAELLRRVAAGERPGGADWANSIEEIESLGRSLINAVESLLLQALVHEFKAVLWPDTPYVEGWRNESRLFQAQAAGQFMPSRRQRIDVTRLMQRVMRAMPATIDGLPAGHVSLLALGVRATTLYQRLAAMTAAGIVVKCTDGYRLATP